MKSLGFIFIAILFGFIVPPQRKSETGNKLKIEFLYSFYREKSEDLIEFDRLVKDSTCIYNLMGTIKFDNDGNTIQKIIKKQKIKPQKLTKIIAKIEKKNYKKETHDYLKVLYIQLKTKDENNNIVLDAKKINREIDKELINNNLGADVGGSEGDGVANLEFEVKDMTKAYNIALNILYDEHILDRCIVGRRLYISADDYNYEIVYPIDYNGSFYPY